MSRASAIRQLGAPHEVETNRTSVSGFSGTLPKAVVAFAGARDGYQVPLALTEAGLLECLITDRYFPSWLSRVLQTLGRAELAASRIPISKVRLSPPALGHFIAEKFGKDSAGGWEKGAAIGRTARKRAFTRNAAVLSYSTSAFEALKDSPAQYKFLFQFHPHPRSIRQIFLEELERVPWTAPSLRREPELALSEDKFELLSKEPTLADGIIVASRFTAKTLIDNGIAADRIHLVPYGVDSEIFRTEPRNQRKNQPLRVAFVGNLEQRKGVSYLLDAIRQIDPGFLCLVICSRSRPRSLWQDKLPASCEFHFGLSRTKMIRVLGSCDLLALPSLVEGFGHVVLEAMSLGLPVIATSHTGAANVLSDELDGFMVPIRDSGAIVGKIEWALDHPEQLRELAACARAKAREFSWERFRGGIRAAYRRMVADREPRHGI